MDFDEACQGFAERIRRGDVTVVQANVVVRMITASTGKSPPDLFRRVRECLGDQAHLLDSLK